MECPSCNADNADGVVFCIVCGANLPKSNPNHALSKGKMAVFHVEEALLSNSAGERIARRKGLSGKRFEREVANNLEKAVSRTGVKDFVNKLGRKNHVIAFISSLEDSYQFRLQDRLRQLGYPVTADSSGPLVLMGDAAKNIRSLGNRYDIVFSFGSSSAAAAKEMDVPGVYATVNDYIGDSKNPYLAPEPTPGSYTLSGLHPAPTPGPYTLTNPSKRKFWNAIKPEEVPSYYAESLPRAFLIEYQMGQSYTPGGIYPAYLPAAGVLEYFQTERKPLIMETKEHLERVHGVGIEVVFVQHKGYESRGMQWNPYGSIYFRKVGDDFGGDDPLRPGNAIKVTPFDSSPSLSNPNCGCGKNPCVTYGPSAVMENPRVGVYSTPNSIALSVAQGGLGNLLLEQFSIFNQYNKKHPYRQESFQMRISPLNPDGSLHYDRNGQHQVFTWNIGPESLELNPYPFEIGNTMLKTHQWEGLQNYSREHSINHWGFSIPDWTSLEELEAWIQAGNTIPERTDGSAPLQPILKSGMRIPTLSNPPPKPRRQTSKKTGKKRRESAKKYFDRLMGNKMMNEEFPDNSQRSAVALRYVKEEYGQRGVNSVTKTWNPIDNPSGIVPIYSGEPKAMTKNLGAIFAEVVIGRNVVKDVGEVVQAIYRGLIGGRTSMAEKRLALGIASMQKELSDNAKALGGNAVANLKMDYEIIQGSATITIVANADAIKLRGGVKKNPAKPAKVKKAKDAYKKFHGGKTPDEITTEKIDVGDVWYSLGECWTIGYKSPKENGDEEQKFIHEMNEESKDGNFPTLYATMPESGEPMLIIKGGSMKIGMRDGKAWLID